MTETDRMDDAACSLMNIKASSYGLRNLQLVHSRYHQTSTTPNMQLNAKFFFHFTALLPFFIAALVRAGPASVQLAHGEVERGSQNIGVDKRGTAQFGNGLQLTDILHKEHASAEYFEPTSTGIGIGFPMTFLNNYGIISMKVYLVQLTIYRSF